MNQSIKILLALLIIQSLLISGLVDAGKKDKKGKPPKKGRSIEAAPKDPAAATKKPSPPPPAAGESSGGDDTDFVDPSPDPFFENKKWSAFVNRVEAMTVQLTDIVNPLASLLSDSNTVSPVSNDWEYFKILR